MILFDTLFVRFQSNSVDSKRFHRSFTTVHCVIFMYFLNFCKFQKVKFAVVLLFIIGKLVSVLQNWICLDVCFWKDLNFVFHLISKFCCFWPMYIALHCSFLKNICIFFWIEQRTCYVFMCFVINWTICVLRGDCYSFLWKVSEKCNTLFCFFLYWNFFFDS